MNYDSTIDTTLHIDRVRYLLGKCAIILLERGVSHDASKLGEPEKVIFDAVGNRLAVVTYDSEEYKHLVTVVTGADVRCARDSSCHLGNIAAKSVTDLAEDREGQISFTSLDSSEVTPV
jgi:hypothetical protein